MEACQLYPLGDTAIVLSFGDSIDLAVHARVRAFAACLEAHPFEGLVEYVPAFTTVTVYYDPWVLSEKGKHKPYEKVTNLLLERLPQAEQYRQKQEPVVVEIPVCYGGELGPDLAFVAQHNQLSEEEVIAIHAAGEYTVYMIGFAPGFPYLGGMDARIATPRKETPRQRIPAGAVGIAGQQTGVYPIETPGGWQLIGRTPLALFDPQRQPPSLLQAGAVVKFIPIPAEAYWASRKEGSR